MLLERRERPVSYTASIIPGLWKASPPPRQIWELCPVGQLREYDLPLGWSWGRINGPRCISPQGSWHSHCVIEGLTLTLIHIIQRKSPYERRKAGETAKCLSRNGISHSKILRWKQKHKPRKLATTIFKAPPGWPQGDSPEAPVWEGLSSSTLAPGLLLSPSLQTLAHALTERGL